MNSDVDDLAYCGLIFEVIVDFYRLTPTIYIKNNAQKASKGCQDYIMNGNEHLSQ